MGHIKMNTELSAAYRARDAELNALPPIGTAIRLQNAYLDSLPSPRFTLGGEAPRHHDDRPRTWNNERRW